MARIRTVKPELAAHEGLYDLERETGLPVRFAWTMLFTVCDREGRFAWRPRTLKAQILPHDDLDFSRVLDAWLTRGFIVKYRVGNAWFGWLPTFLRHQVINNRESASELPDPVKAEETIDNRNQGHGDVSSTRDPRVTDASSTRAVHAQAEGKEGREGKGKEGEGETHGQAAPDVPQSTEKLKVNGHALHAEAEAVLAYLNRAADRSFQFRNPKGELTPNAEVIVSRLKEGYTGEQLREVVMLKAEQWLGDEKMAEYVRPETLFGKKKFATYFGEIAAEEPHVESSAQTE